jgi:hydrogenase maturation protease
MLPTKAVLGLGNPLYGDEGFGIHALQALRTRLFHIRGIELVDGGVLGINLLPFVESCSHLLVLDVVDFGQLPGSVVELCGEQIPLYVNQNLSEHQVGFQEILALARFRGHFPGFFHLIGVQPADLSTGVKLSPPVHAAMNTVVERAIQRLQIMQLS